ncbi:dipeptidase PepE [Pseudidiomarina sediminum]|uniref:Dipeptidase PepE n=1 Tax=Pseudidiomarina sediminum TaxID=431675 RepID=A0A432Z7W8_9GAMM|nr:dipeptidase PepE [Pseudidiomarina sediminum]MBY6063117.1 dipeptidase PepE [Pseudidiomarina sediminum]RUO73968.1 dipeptidase PepE [Pseudidiomarina sediminum]
MTRKLLLCSSSKAGDSAYLEPVLPHLQQRIAAPARLLFIPFAGVGMSYDAYTAKVAEILEPAGYQVEGVHQTNDAASAIATADAILVGGGNTFHLLAELQRQQLIKPLQDAVAAGVCYIGWSAGSNIAGLTIRTTNDMPIIEPESFNALALVPFQLNPHYTDYQPPGFHGETRDQRLAEFMAIAPNTPILAIREGTALWVEDDQMQLLGASEGVVFQAGDKTPLPCNSDISVWLSGK